jgi:hypothetical protein
MHAYQWMPVFFGAELVSPCFCRCLHLWTGMVVHTLGLEEDVTVDVPPEVGDGVAAVAPAGLQLQDAITAGVRALLACEKKENSS